MRTCTVTGSNAESLFVVPTIRDLVASAVTPKAYQMRSSRRCPDPSSKLSLVTSRLNLKTAAAARLHRRPLSVENTVFKVRHKREYPVKTAQGSFGSRRRQMNPIVKKISRRRSTIFKEHIVCARDMFNILTAPVSS